MYIKSVLCKMAMQVLCISSCFLMARDEVQGSMLQKSCDSQKNFKEHLKVQQQFLSQELRRLEKSDPVADLRKALKKKDFRFIGYNSFTTEVPGVEKGQRNRYVVKYGVNKIKGASDVITRQEYYRLQRVVCRYIIPYNKMLFRNLQKMQNQKLAKQSRRKD